MKHSLKINVKPYMRLNDKIIILFIIGIFILIGKMILNIINNNLEEGFTIKNKYSKQQKNEKFRNLKKKLNTKYKDDPYNINIDYSKYGSKTFNKQLPEKNGNKFDIFKRQSNNKYKTTTKKEKFGNAKTETLLRQLDDDANPGKYDNFQNVLDELDNIDADAFKLNNMNSVLTSYNDNLKNRLTYAGKNSLNRFDATMAKGSVLLDEFKKLFSYDKFFK